MSIGTALSTVMPALTTARVWMPVPMTDMPALSPTLLWYPLPMSEKTPQPSPSLSTAEWRFAANPPDCKNSRPTNWTADDCAVNRCMWKHSSPINITKLSPYIHLPKDQVNAGIDNYTLGSGIYHEGWIGDEVQLTSTVHYGTTKAGGIYLPEKSIIPTTNDFSNFPDAEPPSCSTERECQIQCEHAAEKHARHQEKLANAGYGIMGASIFLALLYTAARLARLGLRKRDATTPGDQEAQPPVAVLTSAVDPQPDVAHSRASEEGQGRVEAQEGMAGEQRVEKPKEKVEKVEQKVEQRMEQDGKKVEG